MFRQIKAKIAHKIPRLPRWGRRGIALLSVISCVALSGLTASATEVYNFVFSKPEITSNSCVVEVVTSNGWKMCIYVSAYAGVTATGGFSTTFKAEVLNNELRIYSVKTTTENSSGNTVPVFNRGYYMECNWNTTGSLDFHGQEPATLTLVNSGAITSIHGYNCDVSSVSNNGNFVFLYGSDPVFQNQLNAINSTIESFKGQNQEQLNQILNAIIEQGNSNTQQIKDNADKNANEIKNNQDENSQKIIDNQKQLQENEKNEAQTSGKKSTSDTESAVPTVNEGFGNSIKKFVASMSYNGTEAKLPIPKTSIPAMGNIVGEVELIPEQEYDLAQAINQYIPTDLLNLIRWLFSIALILYCVYELYGMIQYVLTLKKGGKDE